MDSNGRMAFDVLAWALGAALTAISKSILKRVFSKDLSSKLNDAVSQWAEEISSEIQIVPEAIFPETPHESPDDFPKLALLCEEFNNSHIPSQEVWFVALFERWEYVKSNTPHDDVQDFFKLSPDAVKPHLQKLASMLEMICKKDSELFQATSIDINKGIHAIVKDIHAAMQLSPETGVTSSNDPLFIAGRNELRRLGNILSDVQEKELEKYRELYRQGADEKAYNNINELYKSDSFPHLQNNVKAKILRILAAYTLNIKDELEIAEKLLNEAVAIDPSADYSVSLALFEYKKKNSDGALEKIKNPLDIDGFNFRLALLFERGDKESLSNEISQCRFTINAETKRLKALASLFFNKDISAALVDIESALHEKPTWESIQIAYGIINYFSALSPAIIPDQLVQFPAPIPWDFIKQDRESIKRLENAAKQFQSLADKLTSGDPRKLSYMIWNLACLANLPSRQSQAKELARRLLSDNLSDLRIISWIIVRDYDIDLKASLDFLIKVGDDIIGNIDMVLSLVHIYTKTGETLPALKLLEKAKSSFIDNNARDLWHYWYSTVLINNKEYDKALDISQGVDHSDLKLFIKADAIRAKARETNEWFELIEHLDRAYEESTDEVSLLEACQLNAYLGKWDYVSSKSGELLRLLKTPVAVELAVKAAWHMDDPKQCLKLIKEYHGVFNEDVLPSDIARIKVYSQIKIGTIPEALIDAEENYKNDNSTVNLLILLEAQARVGDLKSLSLTARELPARDNIPPGTLLNIARVLITEDKTLSKKLWQKSLSQVEDDPSLIGMAVDIGYRLNLERELRPLLDKMMKFANQGVGNVRAVNFEELLNFIQSNRENNALLLRKYDRAEVPIHMILSQIGVPLTRVYAGISQNNSLNPGPYKQPIIFSRHGGRQIDAVFSKTASDWRLVLDITALLMAQHLDLLDDIEKCFSIRIPPLLQAALIYEKDKLSYHQPSQVAAHKKVIELFDSGALMELSIPDADIAHLAELADKMGGVWVKILETAKSEGSYIVDFLPLRSHGMKSELIELASPYTNHVVACSGLLNILFTEGKIAESTYKSILSDLGMHGAENTSGFLPPLASKIIITDAVLHMLAATEALEIICSNYSVYILRSCINESKGFLKEINDRNNLIDKIDSLLQRIVDGLKSGQYEMLPLQSAAIESEGERNPVVSTVLDLLRGVYDRGDVVWIDDRFGNSYLRINMAPIIGVNEILLSLHELGIMSKDQYFEKLLKLRSSNFRYIPCSKEEIVYYLNKAGIENGSVKETYELKILKRYFASCLLDANRLQKPPMPSGAPNPDGEVMFFVSSVRAISEAISHWWEQDDKNAEAYANWIFINLYTGLYGIRHLRSNDDESNDGLDLIALDIVSAFMRGISMLGESKSMRRKKYFPWIETRILNKRLKLNPEIVDAISKSMESFFSNENLNAPNKEMRIVTQLLLQDYYLSLPNSLQSELRISDAVMNAIGLKTTESIHINGINYPADSFWVAINKTLKGEESTISDLQTGAQYRVSWHKESNGNAFFEIRGEGAEPMRLADPVLGAVSDNLEKIRELLLSNRRWFDLDTKELIEAVNEIASTEILAERIKKIERWRSSSAAFFYEKLENHIVTTHSFKFDELMPSPAGLLRYFRLEIGNKISFTDQIGESAHLLVASEGLEIAIERLSKLPTEMPEYVIERFKALPGEKRQELLTKYSASWASPICKLHLLNLSLVSGEIDIAKVVVDEIFSEKGNQCFKLFKAILNWTNNEIERMQEIKGWHPSAKLAIIWAHSSYLHNIFHLGQAIPEWLAEEFSSADMPLAANEIFNRTSSKWNDILHPNRITRALILCGFGKIISNFEAEVIGELGIEEKIMKYALSEEGVTEFFMFPDPLLTEDNLESLFGGDRSMNLPFLAHDIAKQISSIYLKDTVKNAMHKIRSNQSEYIEWLKLSIILSDLPCYSDLQNDLKEILLGIDFESMLAKSHLASVLALHVGAKQSRYFIGDYVITHIEKGLLQTATFFSGNPGIELAPFTNGQIAGGLIDDALSLSVTENNDREITMKFCKIAQRTFEEWPLTSENIRHGIFRLAQELPASLLHGLWKLILFLRAN